MNEAQAAAHHRLLSKLKPREHKIKDDPVDRHSTRGKPVVVNGREFKSAADAARKLRVSHSKMVIMLRDGRAHYL